MNPYDESVLRRFYKDEGMRDLALIEKNKADNPYWNSYNIFHTKFNNGIAVIPIATQNFTKDLFLPEELDLILRLKEFGFSI